MELLFKRNMSDTVKRILLCLFALVGVVSGSIAQQPATKLPRLSLGVNNQAIVYSGDTRANVWYPDNRIWGVPQRVGPVDIAQPTSEILVPVFIENRWRDFSFTTTGIPTPGVTIQEISSFSFRMYYDESALQFVEVVKEHPYSQEEATSLRTTHFPTNPYTKPLGYNFEVVANVKSVSDYGKYFNKNATSPSTGRTVTVTGIANSYFNLDVTEEDDFKVLVYLRFKVTGAFDGQSNVAAARNSNLYFDPSYICYNGINIAKDRGDKLIEERPLSATDENWNAYLAMFESQYYFDRYINRTNNNFQYFDRNWLGNTELLNAEVFERATGLVADQYLSNVNIPEKFNTDPYLPGSIRVRITNWIPEFNFEALNYNTKLAPEETIVQNATDRSQWTMTEPIIADILQTQRGDYRNQSERAIKITAVTNKDNATGLSRDLNFVMEDIIIETDQPWLTVRTAPHAGDNVFVGEGDGYENKFGDAANYPFRRAFAQRLNNLISIPNNNAYNPLAATNDITLGATPSDFILWVECNPAAIQTLNPDEVPFSGEYIGHVTLKSKYDKYEKTTIQVKFIVVASPEERTEGATAGVRELPYGLKLNVTPNRGTATNLTQTLIMGTSDYATDNADLNAGEYARQEALGFATNGVEKDFDARFFIDPTYYPEENFIENVLQYNAVRTAEDTANVRAEYASLIANGFGDYTHYDGVYNDPNLSGGGVTDNKTPRSNSRDIRSTTMSGQSHIYYVQFSSIEEHSDWYPVVVSWDPRQLQATGSTCSLKYVHNGGTEYMDMKTNSSFILHDNSVTHFWIEYTVAGNEYSNLDDNFGEDIIQANAWNLVSLPLDPINKNWNVVYPNAMAIPYAYNNQQWQETPVLKPGEGYFIKYSSIPDTKFQGAFIDRISASNYPVAIYKGETNQYWNVIGALSKPINIENIDFSKRGDYEPADRTETIRRGVWAYRPKRGYERVYQLFPGKAYFITANSPSFLELDGRNKSNFELPKIDANYTAGFDVINISDATQNTSNVFATNNADIANFELPPVPPAGMFDVRFSHNNYVTKYDNLNNVVMMQGVTYPVTVTFDKPKANYTVLDPITNEVLGKVKAGTTANVVINNLHTNVFKLAIEASDETFFINVNNNPVNTNTADMTFGINSDANVTIGVFNTLGNEVARLDLGYLNTGVYNRTIDIANLPTGAYTVRMMAGNEVKHFMMNVVK